MEDSKQEEVVCKLKIIFEKLLDIKIESLDDLVFGKTKNWDSLKHLQIIINVEKEFSIKIKTEAKSSGGKYVDTSTTMLINFGFFISGYDGVS